MPRKKTDTISTENSNSDNVELEVKTSIPTEKKEEKKFDETDDTALDSQTLHLLERLKQQQTALGGRDPFFVAEKDKDKRFAYQWASTDIGTVPTIEEMEEIGWSKEPGYRQVPTQGYTVDKQPGKHILMKIRKELYAELIRISNGLADRKKAAVMGKELLSRDGGKNVLGSSVKQDDDFFKGLLS